jgi:hypothetical protein
MGVGKNGARNRVRPSSLLNTCKGVIVTITDRMAAWRRERRVLQRVSRAAWRLEQAERERAALADTAGRALDILHTGIGSLDGSQHRPSKPGNVAAADVRRPERTLRSGHESREHPYLGCLPLSAPRGARQDRTTVGQGEGDAQPVRVVERGVRGALVGGGDLGDDGEAEAGSGAG